MNRQKFRVEAVSDNAKSIKLVASDSEVVNRVFNWTPSGHLEMTADASKFKVGQEYTVELKLVPPPEPPKPETTPAGETK